ncbi:aspartate/glutamate racemase family protein [Streptomyces roseicoloratus]|uniref:Aspartate/glutamate racemase family protein n=1 Tax=Streptomyces roseicoloratus TaxID=2508722 RepID=A0ABY9RQ34_9ACTN|nr:aspartate/glutamate racemase family protein [Streptomyces roseicoloratus]WMX44305.1 aspartate/glutamate racemase family protein [Streptomyces roseicoloratus]
MVSGPFATAPGRPAVVLVNPNTSAATTRTMTAIARRALAGTGLRVRGVTVSEGPPMLTDPAALRAAAPHVVTAARAAVASGDCAAVIVAAFGDPGLDAVRALPVPVVGIGAAALAEAAAAGRRFGIATTTPLLADALAAHVARQGLTPAYTGARFTAGDPQRLAARPDALLAALTDAAHACVARDGAEAVVIGGGPLGEAAEALRPRLPVPVVAPIPAACRRVTELLTGAP